LQSRDPARERRRPVVRPEPRTLRQRGS